MNIDIATEIRQMPKPYENMQVAITDTPDSWSALVRQIAELEELLAEAVDGVDVTASHNADALRALIHCKRRILREINIA